MAGGAAVLEDSSLLSRLDRALLPIERFCALLSGLAIFSLMFLAAYSVISRKFFGAPMMGYIDYIEAAMPIIASSTLLSSGERPVWISGTIWRATLNERR